MNDNRPGQEAAGHDVIVLAGGRGSRMGGIDKAALKLAGEKLVDRTVRAARIAGAARVIVVGPDSAGSGADLVLREQPEFGGPLAGIAAGIAEVTAPWVWVLACDLEYPERVCTVLKRHQAETEADVSRDGTILMDGNGREQWLAASYRTEALAAACEALGDAVENAPVRRALAGLKLRELAVPAALAADIDTPEALELARQRAEAPAADPARSTKGITMATHLPPEVLDEWLVAAADELGLDSSEVSIATVLDVAKHVARGVARPAAPLSTFLLGVAFAKSEGSAADLKELSARLNTRAGQWLEEHPEQVQ